MMDGKYSVVNDRVGEGRMEGGWKVGDDEIFLWNFFISGQKFEFGM